MDVDKEERNAEIRSMIDGGMGSVDIARELGVSLNYFYKYCQTESIELRGKRGRRGVLDSMSDEDKDAIVAMYEERQMPTPHILSTFGIDYNALYKLLRERGVDVTVSVEERKAGRKARVDIAVDMYKEGRPYWQITAETGIDQPSLCRELHVRGVVMRKKEKVITQEKDPNDRQPLSTDPNP